MGEKAEEAEAIVEADDDDTLGRQAASVGGGIGRRAELKAAAVKPHHHGPLLVRLLRSGPDVERKAILAARPRPRIILERGERRRAEGQRIAHATPRRRRLRRAPAQRPDRRRGVGDAFECEHAFGVAWLAAHEACLRPNGSVQLGCCGNDRAVHGRNSSVCGRSEIYRLSRCMNLCIIPIDR